MMFRQTVRRNRRLLLSLLVVFSLVLIFSLGLRNSIKAGLEESLAVNARIHSQSIEADIVEETKEEYVKQVSLFSNRLSDDQAIALVEQEQIVSKAVPEFLFIDNNSQVSIRSNTNAIKRAIEQAEDTIVHWKDQQVYGIAYQIGEDTLGLWVIETIPSSYFQTQRSVFWATLLLMTLVIILLTIVIYRETLRNVNGPLEEIEEGIKGLLDADFSYEYMGDNLPMINQLGDTTNQVVKRLANQRSVLFMSQQQLSLLLDHLILGVVVVNQNGKIELFNPAAQKLLVLDDTVIGRSYESVIKSFLLINMINIVAESGVAMSDEVEMFIPKSRYIDVNIIPFTQEDIRTQGSVLVLLYDVTEIHRLENVRTEFVANASHELRTPVTAIKGFAETLLSGALEERKLAKNFIEIIANESNRLEVIINDILELSRVEKRTVPLVYSQFDIVEIAHSMTDFFLKKAKKKNISISITAEAPVLYTGDQHRIEQIFTNLIDNAINYSDVNSKIKIEVWEKKHNIKFSVSDTGIGIPEENQERIFERFYRVDKGRSRNSGGTGLGLSIVRNLIKNLNGKIELESELGKGSTFTISLPKE